MTARRARGEGSVYYDKNAGLYVGCVSLGIVNGKRVRRKVSGRTKTEARRKLAELAAAARATGTIPRADITVGHLIDDLLAYPPASWKSEITLGVNANHAKRIRAALGHVKVTRLSVSQVESFLAGMAQQGYSASVIGDTRALLRKALRRAERDHGLLRNVAALAELPAGPKRTSQSMAPDQVDALLAVPTSPWWRAYLHTALMMGLRPGELLGLSWEDIDFDTGTLRVRHSLKRVKGVLQLSGPKTLSSHRTVRMPTAVVTALRDHRKDQLKKQMKSGIWEDHGLVFPGRAGKPSEPMAVRRRFNALCEKAGIGTSWQLRETRHTAVSVMSSMGVPIEEISDVVGHANSNITRTVYRHQIGDVVAGAAVAWDAYTASPKAPAKGS
jgi:integrase